MRQTQAGLRLSIATVVLGTLASVFVLHPFTPSLPHAGLDPSWVAVLGEAADQRTRWGVDLDFTYGPASPLATGYFNAAYLTRTLPLTVGFALLFGWCMALLVAGRDRTPATALAGTAACALMIVACKNSPDALFLVLPFLVFLLALPRVAEKGSGRARTFACVIGALAIGLTAMVKSSFPLAALSLFLIGDAAALMQRRWPRLVVPFGLGFLGGDLLYGQHLADLPAFVVMQGEVVAGFAAAQGLDGPDWDLAGFGVLAAALLIVVAIAARRGAGLWIVRWLLPLGLAADLMVLFKAGFVRHDLHSLTAWSGASLAATVLAWACLRRWSRRAALAITGVAVIVVLVYVPILTVRQSVRIDRGAAFARLYGGWLFDGPPAEVTHAVDLLRNPMAFVTRLDAGKRDAWAAIAAAAPLGPLPGSVDIIPSAQSRLLAAGLDYRPRPSFQSYNTYTARLIAANRAFVAGPDAPDWILFGPEHPAGLMVIDGKFPGFAEGALWPDLLSRYAPDHRIGMLSALRRRDTPLPVPLGPGDRVETGFGRFVPVAAKGPVWSTIDVRPNALGQIAGLLFRPPPIGIAVRLDDGRERRFSFVPAIGSAGFVLSPLVDNASDFDLLARGRDPGPGNHVVAVAVEASRVAAAFYAPGVVVSLRDIDTKAISAAAPVDASAWVALRRTAGGGDDLQAPAPSLVSLPIADLAPVDGQRHVRLGFGIADGAWSPGHTAGVCFAIGPADGTDRILWRSCLDPVAVEADRGRHEVDLAVPVGISEIVLRTTCRAACDWGWSYWAKPSGETAAG